MGLFDFGKKNKYFRIAEEAFEAGDYGRSFEYYTLASDLGHLQAKRNLAY